MFYTLWTDYLGQITCHIRLDFEGEGKEGLCIYTYERGDWERWRPFFQFEKFPLSVTLTLKIIVEKRRITLVNIHVRTSG